jgi:hypothetical protein
MVDKVEITPELNPESQEYIDSMAAKGAAAVNGGVEPEAPVEIAPKPEGIPDKFYNTETGVVDYQALAKSYVELEKTKGTPVEPPKEVPKTPAPAKEGEPKETPANAEEAVEKAGLDMATLSQEFAETGALATESYDKLEKAGISKAMVDDYIEGQKAQVALSRLQAFEVTEGEDGYKAMVEYAKANLSPEDISAYNKAVNSKDSSVRDLAVRGMWSRYVAESGNTSGSLITPKTNSKVGDGSYQSRAEMMADMGNPKYKTDPAFRATVEAKLAKSTIF